MSAERSSSAVRNLRSIFENKASESSPNPRGRSPGSLGVGADLDVQRPRSKVRASFIAVRPTMAALAAEQEQNSGVGESGVGSRRTEVSGGSSGDVLAAMKSSGMVGQRNEETSESAIESAVATPLTEVSKQLGKAKKTVKDAITPDKSAAGAEGSQTVTSSAKSSKPKSGTSRPSTISTKNKAPSTSLNSPSQAKSPSSATSSTFSPKPKAPVKKASRSSLTAPTAASVARAAANDKAGGDKSLPPKPKPRDVTKPVEISSRLTAPTAASRARLESASTSDTKPTPTIRPKPAGSARPTPRSSLAGRPDSQSSGSASRKPAGAVDGSFLDRMTRPTAASSNKTHEKSEAKSPPPKPKQQVPLRPKTNGVPKHGEDTASSKVETAPVAERGEAQSVTPAVEEPTDTPAVEDTSEAPASEEPSETVAVEKPVDASALKEPSSLPGNDQSELPVVHAEYLEEANLLDSQDVPKQAITEPVDELTGSETPAPHVNSVTDDTAAMESTPAAIGEEDLIR